MDGETKAWIVIVVATLVSFVNDIFNFLPTKADKPNGWDNLYFVVMGGAIVFLLVKKATKEALKEHERNH